MGIKITRKFDQTIYGDDENVHSSLGFYIQLYEVEWYRRSPPSHDLGFDSIAHAGRRQKVENPWPQKLDFMQNQYLRTAPEVETHIAPTNVHLVQLKAKARYWLV